MLFLLEEIWMFLIVFMVIVNWGSLMLNRIEDMVFGGMYMMIGRVVRLLIFMGWGLLLELMYNKDVFIMFVVCKKNNKSL